MQKWGSRPSRSITCKQDLNYSFRQRFCAFPPLKKFPFFSENESQCNSTYQTGKVTGLHALISVKFSRTI